MQKIKMCIMVSIVVSVLLLSISFLYSYLYIEGNKWRASALPVVYKINTGGAPSGASDAIQNSFNTWQSASNSWMRFQYGGTTGATFQDDNINSLSWGYAFGAIAASAKFNKQ